MGVLRCTFELHVRDCSSSTDVVASVQTIINKTLLLTSHANVNGANWHDAIADKITGVSGPGSAGVTSIESSETNVNGFASQHFPVAGKQLRTNVDIFPQCVVFDVAVQVLPGGNVEALKLLFRRMLENVGSVDTVTEVRHFPFLEHGMHTHQLFFETSDGRMIEYEFKSLIFSQRSDYQLVEIYDTIQFGRLLVLDKFQQLAESDLIYTTSIMRKGLIPYSNRQVLILGGGDGALLHEVLKEQPAHVVVVDIDEVVVKAVRQYMPSVCGDALDKYKSSMHTILIGDAFKYLEHAAADGKMFDVIISDLTDFPITAGVAGDQWNLLKHVIDLSMPCLKNAADDGHFLIHGVGRSAQNTLHQFEELLDNFKQPKVKQLRWERHEAFVPSFLEYWQFYDVQKLT